MAHTRIAVLTRMKDLDGRTLCFTLLASGGRRLHDFIDKERVPDFEGDQATFETEKVREPGSPWLRWRVIRRVEGV
ncbi:MAG: hypothetical protein JO127_10365 [Caulobacteraceae bacterium]|nr:hypothetical protein [Caulobacteraceae bacterium]